VGKELENRRNKEEKGVKSFLDIAERISMVRHRIKSIPATKVNEPHLHEKQS
jgi:hypothetical protein